MQLHNCRTVRDWRLFSFRRNRCLGQLSMAKASIQNMLDSDLISEEDKEELKKANLIICLILGNWDPHYTKKLKDKLKQEENS